MDKPTDAQAAPHPVLNAMLVCDQAIREEGSAKVSLIGIFENVNAESFPVLHPSFAVYVKLVDAIGEYRISLLLLHLRTGKELGSGGATVDIPDRMQVAEFVFPLRNVIFPEAGVYEFRLFANDKYLGSKTFRVLSRSAPAEQP